MACHFARTFAVISHFCLIYLWNNNFGILIYFYFKIFFSSEKSYLQFLSGHCFDFEYPFCQFTSTEREVKSWWMWWLICGFREFSKTSSVEMETLQWQCEVHLIMDFCLAVEKPKVYKLSWGPDKGNFFIQLYLGHAFKKLVQWHSYNFSVNIHF